MYELRKRLVWLMSHYFGGDLEFRNALFHLIHEFGRAALQLLRNVLPFDVPEQNSFAHFRFAGVPSGEGIQDKF